MDGKKICKIILYISGFIFYSLMWVAMLYMVWVECRTANASNISLSDQLMMTAIIGAFWITAPIYGYVKFHQE